jgi:hypothetical protein
MDSVISAIFMIAIGGGLLMRGISLLVEDPFGDEDEEIPIPIVKKKKTKQRG